MKKVLLISLALVLAISVGLIGCTAEVPEITEYNLTISSTEGGSVTTPGQGTESFTYDEGEVVNLLAEPDEGYEFVNWTGDVGTVADVNAASTTITMNGNYSITANFHDMVITLDFATFWPSDDFQAGVGHVNWMTAITDAVEANTPDDETGYTVEWNGVYNTHPKDLWSGVLAGTYDVITSATVYTWGIMPLWEGPQYPADLCRKNALTMSMSLQALYDQFTPLHDEMDDAGVKVMHFWSTGPGYFLMTEGNHVETLEDMAALTKPIRAANPASVAAIEALGAEFFACTMYQALEEFAAGTISGMLFPKDAPKSFGMSYIKHCTFAPFSYQFVFMKVMNKDAWDSLPTVVQDAFNEVNEAWPEYYGKLRTWGEADGLKYCYEEIDGFTYYDLPNEDPDEYARWVDATADCVTDWIGGDATKQALWDKFVELNEYYCTHEPWASWVHGANPPEPPSF